MKILWLAPYAIWPPTHGGKIRVYNLVRQLSGPGDEIEVWSISDEAPPTSLPEMPRVAFRFLPTRPRSSLAAKASAATSALPSASWSLRSPEAVSYTHLTLPTKA